MKPAVRSFIEQLALQFCNEGMPLIAGRVTAYLLVSEGPRSLDEIATALGVSRASVSTDTRRLEEKGMLVRLTLPGDRRTYYSFAPDGFRTALVGRIHSLTRFRKTLEDAESLPVAAESAEVSARLAEWIDFHVAVIDSLDDLLEKWKKRTAPRRTSRRRRNVA